MARLTDLPNELQILVFTHCTSICTAVRLSEVCSSLREVWLENLQHITREILERQLPAFDDALELSREECGEESSFTQCIPRILHNATLAQDVYLWWPVYVLECPAETRVYLEGVSSIPMLYYTIRRLVNAHANKELQAKLHPIIAATSIVKAENLRKLSNAMWFSSHGDRLSRHEMPKGESLWMADEPEEGSGVKDEWDFALDICELIGLEKMPHYRQGFFSSNEFPCLWTFGDKCCGEDCRRGETWDYDTRPL